MIAAETFGLMTSQFTPAQSPTTTATFWCCSCEREYDAESDGSVCQRCWDLEPQWQQVRSAPVGQTYRHDPLPGTKNYTDVIVTPLRYDTSVGEHMFDTGPSSVRSVAVDDRRLLDECHPWEWAGIVATQMLELVDRLDDNRLGASLVGLLATFAEHGDGRVLRPLEAFTPNAVAAFERHHPDCETDDVRLAATVTLLHIEKGNCGCGLCSPVIGDFGAMTPWSYGGSDSPNWVVRVAAQWMVEASGGSRDARLLVLAAHTAALLDDNANYRQEVLTLDAVARSSADNAWSAELRPRMYVLAKGLLDHRFYEPDCGCVLCHPYLSRSDIQ